MREYIYSLSTSYILSGRVLREIQRVCERRGEEMYR